MIKDNSCSQIRIITRITSIACMISMLLSYKLWLSDRIFPTTPVSDFLPLITHPYDMIIFGISITLLVFITVLNNPKKLIIAFLCFAIFLAIFDQNRWQPWFYQYLLMFFVLSFFNYRCDDNKQQNAIVTIFKLMIGAVYFWSGLQKLNPNFLADTYPWLMEPITNHFGPDSINNIKWLGNLFPLIEILTGIGLFLSPTKKAAVLIATGMHIFILFALGPFGHNYNPVVWPWNVAMIYFCFFLFYNDSPVKMQQLRSMLHYHSIKIVAILFILMPLFNFFNMWDSYLSHNLYSGNTSGGVIYLSDNTEKNIPAEIKPYSMGEMDQNQITIKYWCMMELGVPAYPEKRNFQAISNTFYKYASDSSEIYFMFTPKLKVSDL